MTNVRQVLERLSNATDRTGFEKILRGYDMTFRRINDQQMIESIDRLRKISEMCRWNRGSGIRVKRRK